MSEYKNFGQTLGLLMVRFKWLVAFLSIALFMGLTSGGRFIEFSNDVRYFFGETNPQLEALDALENVYSKDDNVIVAIAPKSKNVFTGKTLKMVQELTESFWQLPFSRRVDSITNYQHTTANGDDLIVEDLVKEPLSLSKKELVKIKNIAVNEPLLKNRVVSPSGHVTGINILFRMPEDAKKKTVATTKVIASVRDTINSYRVKYPDHDFYIGGGLMISNAFAEASQDDMKTLIPIMYLMMVIVMWLTIRSISGTITATLIIFMSALSAMGLSGWLGITLTPPSAMAPTIILTLAVADSIHILVTFLNELRKGLTKNDAVVESMRLNMMPVFLTSITTAIGFMSMNFSDSPPFRDLGNIVAMGVMAAWFYSVTFLPAMMAILPVKASKIESRNDKLIDRFADFVIKKRKSLLWGMTIFILVLMAGLTKVELNDLYLDYFDKRYDFRNDTDFIKDNLTGISMIEYSLNSGEEGGISDPAYLKTMDNFTAWLLKQPEVLNVTNISDIMKRLNKNMHGDDETYYKIPENRELSAQYLLLYEMSLPFGLDLNDTINVDKSATRLRISLTGIYNKEIRAFEKRASGWLKDNASPSMQSRGTGITIMFAYINKRNVQGMLGGTFYALLLISAILVFALRSLKVGLISLIPNLVPAFMAFGLWGYLFSQIGLAVSVVAAMSLGIVVDDTIHFLSKYLRARREHNMEAEEAVRYSFHNVGRALIVTSIILIAGFGILTFSGFKINANMGLLTAIAIAFALLTDFLLLPPLLMKFDSKKG